LRDHSGVKNDIFGLMNAEMLIPFYELFQITQLPHSNSDLTNTATYIKVVCK